MIERVQCPESDVDTAALLDRFRRERRAVVLDNCFGVPDDDDGHRIAAARATGPLRLSQKCFEPLVWHETRDKCTPLHYDNPDNTMVVITGLKVFVIYPPSQHRYLHHKSGPTGRFRQSRIDIESPDLASYPDFAKSKPLLAPIPGGSVLLLPANWSHQVYTAASEEAPTIAINSWYVTTPAMLVGRGTPALTSAWSVLFNTVIDAKIRYSSRPKFPSLKKILRHAGGDASYGARAADASADYVRRYMGS